MSAQDPVLDHSSVPAELYFLTSRHSAKLAGFDDSGRHRQFPTWRAWWPGCDVDRLAAMVEPWRVVIAENFLRGCSGQERREAERAVYIMRHRQRRWAGSAVWMEL